MATLENKKRIKVIENVTNEFDKRRKSCRSGFSDTSFVRYLFVVMY